MGATPPVPESSRGQRTIAELYDLVFVEPGPLPPHERSWRHPSELGPTRFDVDDSRARPTVSLFALGGGTLAVLAVAMMVVAMTPRTSSGPMALGATTTPITVRATVSPPPSEAASSTPTARTVQLRRPTALLTSFVAYPHTVTAGPQLDLDGTAIADDVPADDDMVFVRTEAVTYRLQWGEAQFLAAPDGSVYFDDAGDLVAHVSDGELVSLVAD